ncbi:hypothetical protein MMPV_001561 [Pyropia vietnamensis]
MATSTFKYVILGGGNAAGYAARAFVAENATPGSVCMVSREEVLPYERPALSKAFLFADPPARLPGFHTCVGGGGDRQDAAWYESKGIDVKLGTNVTAVDVAAKKLTTASGDTIVATDALILATGCEAIKLARTPGADLKGIHTLREYADGLELYDGLKACSGKKVVVVGGGYIGMEVAAAATLMACDVTMLFPESFVMPRLFTPEIAAHYEAAYKANRVKLLNDGRLCEAFLDDGSGAVKGVMFCKDQVKAEVEGQLVVVGVGARPNVGLFKDQGLKTAEGGLVVDGCMETSAPGVYAVGDIATFPLLLDGGALTRSEHVAHARASAAQAVAAAMGKSPAPYDYIPFFYSRVFGFSWKFYGFNRGTSVTVGDFAPTLATVWVDGGKAVGVFMESPSDEQTAVMQAMARAQPVVELEALQKLVDGKDAAALISAVEAATKSVGTLANL